MKIQKEFKVTPHFMDIRNYSNDDFHHMGVYLCLGQQVHNLKHSDAVPLSKFSNYGDIHQYMSMHGKIFIFLGEGKHKNKKKAEQMACENAIHQLP